MAKTRAEIWARAYSEAQHIIRTGDTLRETASHFEVKKSTVHKDVSQRLVELYPETAAEVAVILREHQEEAPYRAALAKKKKQV